jgi:DNA-binding transcriptional LysR family regulator
MATLQCEDIASLIDVVRQTDAVFLGIMGAARQGLADGSLVELTLDPPFRAGARLGLITLAGRTELPVMAVFRTFVMSQLVD